MKLKGKSFLVLTDRDGTDETSAIGVIRRRRPIWYFEPVDEWAFNSQQLKHVTKLLKVLNTLEADE